MWTKDSGFTGNCIGEVQSGETRISGMRIKSARGPQQSIFVFAEHIEYPKIKKGSQAIKYHRMAGIGAYGWDDPTNRIMKAAGKKRIPKGADLMLCSGNDEDGKAWEGASLWFLKKKKVVHDWIRLPARASLKSKFVGIQKETVKEFFKWLEETLKDDHDGLKWMAKIDRKKAMRFNQGDAYFTQRMGGSIPATKPGKSKEPTLTRIVKSWGKKKATKK